MIPRYSRPEMAAIWTPETRFRIWFEIEAHAASAMAELGMIPKSAAKTIWEKGQAAPCDTARIDEIEREVKHDVVAFLTHLAEIVGPDARFVHLGMTSSDVLDTCLNVQLVRAADILLADVDALLAALERRAREYKFTPTIGRSHGIHAEPTTFGLKLAVAFAEFSRARARLQLARKEVATCAISGAVGTFAQVDPRVEPFGGKKRGACGGADLDPDHPARPPCHVFRHARRGGRLDRAARHRNPPLATHRGFGGGGIFLRRAKGLFFHAAQAQSGAVGESRRAGADGARLCRAGAGGRRAVARTRHFAFFGRAHDRPRRDGNARLRTGSPCRCHRQADRLSGKYAKEPRPARRPGAFPTRSAGAGAKRRGARGRLSAGAAERHESVGRRRRFSGTTQCRPGRAQAFERSRAESQFRPRFSPGPGRYDLRPGVRPALTGVNYIRHSTVISGVSSPCPTRSPDVGSPNRRRRGSWAVWYASRNCRKPRRRKPPTSAACSNRVHSRWPLPSPVTII